MSILHSKQTPPEIVRSVSYPYRTHGTRPISKSRKHPVAQNFGKFFVAIFVIGIAGFIFLTPRSGDPKTLGVSAQEAKTMKQPEPEKIPSLDHTVMANEINAVINKYPSMDIGVSWIDIKTGESGDYGVQVPFVAASTAKLLTATAFLHEVETGNAKLTDQVGSRTAQAALEAMIVKSDNEAWNDFNNSVMSHKQLEAYAQTIGFTDYDSDKNTVTPANLAKLLSNFYQKRLLNDEHTSLLLSYMQRAELVPYISDVAPAGVKVYHKPGFLTDRVHDATIIDNGDRPYVLVIFTKSRTGSYNTTSGVDIFTTIAKSSFTSFLIGN
jgi:beta-lactamase class A